MTSIILCLAINLYHEARGTDLQELYAISNVVMNRVNSEKYPDDVCSVITEPYQFSWTNGLSNPIQEPKPFNLLEIQAWDEILLFSKWFIPAYYAGGTLDITNGSQFYAVKHMKPYWSKNMQITHFGSAHTYYTNEVQSTACIQGSGTESLRNYLETEYEYDLSDCAYVVTFNEF